MMSCKDLARAIAAEETSGWRRWLAIRLHLLRCPACKEYVKQVHDLGDCVRNEACDSPEDAATLERLEEAIMGEIDRDGGAV
jgi:hypothetical protein